jgi:hypothetical protein
MGFEKGHPFYLLLREQQDLLNMASFIAFGTLIVIVMIAGILISHRIAGPIYKIKLMLDNDIAGKELNIKLRQNDFFLDLAEKINTFAKKYKK